MSDLKAPHVKNIQAALGAEYRVGDANADGNIRIHLARLGPNMQDMEVCHLMVGAETILLDQGYAPGQIIGRLKYKDRKTNEYKSYPSIYVNARAQVDPTQVSTEVAELRKELAESKAQMAKNNAILTALAAQAGVEVPAEDPDEDDEVVENEEEPKADADGNPF